MNLGMSLGSMANGAVQGYDSQERLQLAQKSEADNVNLRNRQMVMAEKDQAYQDSQRQRQEQDRNASAALYKKFYGEQQETVGETESTAPDGSITKVPTVVTKNYQPGQDATRDNKWYVEHLAMNARRSGMSMEDFAKVAERVDNGRRTEGGRALDKVLMGDDDATATFLKAMGKDPKGAKLDRRPADGVNEIVLADGSKVDLKRAAAATATAAYYKELMGEEKSAMEAGKVRASTSNLQAQSALHAAQAGEIPSKINRNNAEAGKAGAQAGLASARAKNVGAATQSLKDDKVTSQVTAQIKLVQGSDPSDPTGKAKNPDHASYLQGRAAEILADDPKKDARTAVAKANSEYASVDSQATAWMQKNVIAMKPADRKAKYGTTDVAAIKAMAVKAALPKYSAPAAPSAPAGQSSSDDNADE